MVVVAVLGLIQPAELVRLLRLGRIEFWVAVITAVAGLVFGLLPAVLVGVLLTLFLVLRELDRAGLTELQPTADDGDMRIAGSAGAARSRDCSCCATTPPLYTANIRSVHRKILGRRRRPAGAARRARPRLLGRGRAVGDRDRRGPDARPRAR